MVPLKAKRSSFLWQGEQWWRRFCCCQALGKKKAKLKVALMAPLKALSPDAKIMYRRLSKIIRPSLFTVNPSEESLHSLTQDADILIDALLGTGLSSAVRPPYSSAIEAMNASQAFTLAIDIPSGLDSNTGAILGTAVQSDLTERSDARNSACMWVQPSTKSEPSKSSILGFPRNL